MLLRRTRPFQKVLTSLVEDLSACMILLRFRFYQALKYFLDFFYTFDCVETYCNRRIVLNMKVNQRTPDRGISFNTLPVILGRILAVCSFLNGCLRPPLRAEWFSWQLHWERCVKEITYISYASGDEFAGNG